MAEPWTASLQANGIWLFLWDADSGEAFDVWLLGELLETVTGGEYECAVSGYDTEPPPLEIVDDQSGVVADNEQYPPYAVLQWREVTGAFAYIVQQYKNGIWVDIKTIMDSSSGYYWFNTQTLTDGTTNQFRIYASDDIGNTGTPISFNFVIMCNPLRTSVTYEIDSNGDLVVGAA